jgi:hypothetical protein
VRPEYVDRPAPARDSGSEVKDAETIERMRVAGHIAGDEDGARAGPPDGHAVGDPLLELRDESVQERELADRRALPARNDERVDIVQLLRPANIDGVAAESLEGVEMLAEIALQAEDTGAS